MTTPKKRGRPPAGPGGQKQVRHSVRLYPHEVDHLVRRYGSIHAGVRALVEAEVKTKKEAR